jgi:DNA-binding HxlR family transcriptional regulator
VCRRRPESLRPAGVPAIHEPSCRSFQDVLELVGRRWSGAILLAGQRGARRFGEYRLSVPAIPDRLLAQRLKELQTAGLISRTVIPSTPVQIRYDTGTCRDRFWILAVVRLQVRWARARQDSNPRPSDEKCCAWPT